MPISNALVGRSFKTCDRISNPYLLLNKKKRAELLRSFQKVTRCASPFIYFLDSDFLHFKALPQLCSNHNIGSLKSTKNINNQVLICVYIIFWQNQGHDLIQGDACQRADVAFCWELHFCFPSKEQADITGWTAEPRLSTPSPPRQAWAHPGSALSRCYSNTAAGDFPTRLCRVRAGNSFMFPQECTHYTATHTMLLHCTAAACGQGKQGIHCMPWKGCENTTKYYQNVSS